MPKTSNIVNITESQFQQSVIDLARAKGWLVYHTWRSDNSAPGFPDLTMVRRERLVFAELKVNSNKPTPAQEQWLTALAAVQSVDTVQVYVWTPDDWAEIEATL